MRRQAVRRALCGVAYMVKFGSESEQRAVYEENRKAVDQIIERVKQHDIPKPAAKRKAI